VAYAIADEREGDRGIYFPQSRIFPRELSTVFHEIGHLQRCGNRTDIDEGNAELIAILNELEQMMYSFGLLHNTQDQQGSIASRVGFTLPFYREQVFKMQRYMNDRQAYWVGALSVLDELAARDGDFAAVRENFTLPECSTQRQQYYTLRSREPEIVETMEATAETPEELQELRRFALSQAWPIFQRGYRAAGRELEREFGEETAAAWQEYADTLDFPKR